MKLDNQQERSINVNILSKIHSPEDLRPLNQEELTNLSEEIRSLIIERVLKNGGHLASNLGTVELTLALHKVFQSPQDQIIWDVGHQCYTHKLLTGRQNEFSSLRQKDGISGFPKREESPHDTVNTGHSSTSISVASGILAGKKLQEIPGKVIAVIGDGALTGGMALEALNYSGSRKDDLIIILNDNEMSISANVGAMSRYLNRLTVSKSYQQFRNRFDHSLERIPWIGKKLSTLVHRLKRAAKAVVFKKTLFSDFGFTYVGPIDGHNIKSMEEIFQGTFNIKGPCLLHVITKKGKGYPLSEQNPSDYHGVSVGSSAKTKSFSRVFSDYIVEKAKEDPKITAVTAAMAKGTGLDRFQKEFPERFFDVGIAEQHAVTFAGSMGMTGLKPVLVLYSTFMQRAVDQILHDIRLSDMPLLLGLDRAGLVGGDGETHQGLYDIALLKSIPGLYLLSPCCEEEFKAMIDFALESRKAVVIRYPKAPCPDYFCSTSSFSPGTGIKIRSDNSSILLVTTGGLYPEAHQASINLNKQNLFIDTYNMSTLSPINYDLLSDEWEQYDLIFFIEEGMQKGGLGEEFHRMKETFLPRGKLYNKAVGDCFLSQASRAELLEHTGLNSQSIEKWIMNCIDAKQKVMEEELA